MAHAGEPAQFAIGIKELWDIPKDRLKPGTVIHTLGYPLREEEFGGSWLYAMPDGRISIGFVVGLDYQDPLFDPHAAFQHFKRHPFISSILEGGQMVRYGAKALPEGGWNTQPRLVRRRRADRRRRRQLRELDAAQGHSPGDAQRHARRRDRVRCDARRRHLVREVVAPTRQRVDASAIKTELYPVRNVHQAFGDGLVRGQPWPPAWRCSRKACCCPNLHGHAGHKQMQTIEDYYGLAKRDILVPSNAAPIDRKLTFDKVTGAHYSGTHHDEDQPVHLLVQHRRLPYDLRQRVRASRASGSVRPTSTRWSTTARAALRLQINASNCVHCKTCDIMDPYGVITWVAPEGGEGPSYDGM